MSDDIVEFLRRCYNPEVHVTVFKAAARIEALEAVLRRCQTVLSNMALEDGRAYSFKRWAISDEPLRNDASNLLPVIDAALASPD